MSNTFITPVLMRIKGKFLICVTGPVVQSPSVCHPQPYLSYCEDCPSFPPVHPLELLSCVGLHTPSLVQPQDCCMCGFHRLEIYTFLLTPLATAASVASSGVLSYYPCQ